MANRETRFYRVVCLKESAHAYVQRLPDVFSCDPDPDFQCGACGAPAARRRLTKCYECDLDNLAPRNYRHEDGCACVLHEDDCPRCQRRECIHALEECRVAYFDAKADERIEEEYR